MTFLKRILEERWLLYIGLFGLAVGLPLSRAFVSIAPGILIGAWLFDGLYRKDLRKKWKDFTSNKTALGFSGIFILYAVSGIWSADEAMSVKLVLDKLPWVILPLAFSGLPLPSERSAYKLLWIHTAAIVLSTILCYLNFLSLPDQADPKEAMLFVNHIRLSLMIVLSMVFMFRRKGEWKKTPVLISVIISLWYLFFLWEIQMATGFGLLLVLALIAGIGALKKPGLMRVLGGLALLLFLSTSLLTISIAKDQFLKPKAEELELKSAQGHRYYHDKENLQLENGHYVWRYLLMKEMIPAWNERSEKKIAKDAGTDDLFVGGLIRYLTSMGLRKDADGVNQLSEEDIQRIEMGFSSVEQGKSTGMEERIKKLCFEIDSYRYGGDPSQSSLTVKLEYWKTGRKIFAEHPWLGVGIGDVKNSFWSEYEKGSRLSEDAWDKAHQQYLTWLITFGLLGAVLVLFAFLRPLLFEQFGYMRYPVILIYGVFLVSFMVEDTLETQLGINLFLFYSGLIIFPAIQKSSTSR